MADLKPAEGVQQQLSQFLYRQSFAKHRSDYGTDQTLTICRKRVQRFKKNFEIDLTPTTYHLQGVYGLYNRLCQLRYSTLVTEVLNSESATYMFDACRNYLLNTPRYYVNIRAEITNSGGWISSSSLHLVAYRICFMHIFTRRGVEHSQYHPATLHHLSRLVFL